jgi:hypothetical protein
VEGISYILSCTQREWIVVKKLSIDCAEGTYLSIWQRLWGLTFISVFDLRNYCFVVVKWVTRKWEMSSFMCGISWCTWSVGDTNYLSLHNRWKSASKSVRQNSLLPYSGDVSLRYRFAIMNSETSEIPWSVTVCIQDYGELLALCSIVLVIFVSHVMRRISHRFRFCWWVIL